LSFIGTFTTPDYNPPGIAPPQAMKNAAVELFSWKADQKHIDVYDASRLPNLTWGLTHLMGHRDVYGTTECPGTQAHDIIPWLRDEISRKIGFVSPHIYVDELSSAFSKNSSEFWYVPPKNCGYNGHSYYTWSTTNPANSSNWGEWRPNLPVSDHYQVEVYAPYCVTGRGETRATVEDRVRPITRGGCEDLLLESRPDVGEREHTAVDRIQQRQHDGQAAPGRGAGDLIRDLAPVVRGEQGTSPAAVIQRQPDQGRGPFGSPHGFVEPLLDVDDEQYSILRQAFHTHRLSGLKLGHP